MKTIVVLYSGGLDSFVLWRLALTEEPGARVKRVYYGIGSPWERKELAALRGTDVEVRSLPWPGQVVHEVEGKREGAIYVPGRNLLFATAAACHDVPNEVWLGAQTCEAHEKATDKNQRFLDAANASIGYALSPFTEVRIRAPFLERRWNKADEVRWALERGGATLGEIGATISCYHEELHRCGNCIQCFRRWCVMASLGISEVHHEEPWSTEVGRRWMEITLGCAAGVDDYLKEGAGEQLEEFLGPVARFVTEQPGRCTARARELLRMVKERG